MAATKQDIFAKIGDLLLELNEQYAALGESESCELVEVSLLEAKAKFLANHINILKVLKLQSSKPEPDLAEGNSAGYRVDNEVKKVAFADFFTPPSTHSIEETDSQQIHAEIEDDLAATADKSTPSEHDIKEEAMVLDSTPSPQYEPIDENPKVEVQLDQAETATDIPAVEAQPIKQMQSFFETTAPREENSVPAFPDPVEERPVEPVVNTVIIEEKEVVVAEQKNQVDEKSTRPLTLNEMISQQKKAGLNQQNIFQTNQHNAERITDLKSAVSLNDKLLFIKDLFNGYSLAYSEAIELLNRFDNFAEADAFLQTNYSLKNGWADKTQTVDKLYAVLRKRFI